MLLILKFYIFLYIIILYNQINLFYIFFKNLKKMRIYLILIILNNIFSYIEIPFTLTSSNKGKHYYIIPIFIGTPEQKFLLQLDTSNANTWIPSTYCNNCKDVSLYKDKNSTSSNTTKNKAIIYDEDSIVNGYISYEKININNKIKIPKIGFIQIISFDNEFNDYNQGKLGLGYRGFINGDFNLLNMLLKNNIIQKRIFSIELKNENGGNLYFDKYQNSESEYECNITSYENLNIIYRQSWICFLSHVIIEEEEPIFIAGYDILSRILFDSSYEYIAIPYRYFYTIKENLFDAFLIYSCDLKNLENNKIKEYYYECNEDGMDIKKLKFNFVIQGYAYQIHAKDLFKKIGDKKYESLIRFIDNVIIDEDKSNYDDGDEEDVWMVGFPFFKNFLVRYDFERRKVGFKETKGKIFNLTSDWNDWYNEYVNDINHSKTMRFLFIGIFILSSIFVVFVGILCYRGIKRRNRFDDMRPLFTDNQINNNY